MSKFTEGPWGFHKHAYCCVVGPDGSTVVANCGGGDRNYDVDALRETQKANTNLIAAAPDMYEVLELLYEHCRLYHKAVETNNVGEAVRAALAKARGEQ